MDAGRAAFDTGDYSTAMRELKPLALQGNAHAQVLVGTMLYSDTGPYQVNEAEAASWFRRAADQGNASAQGILGDWYRVGKAVPQDSVQSVRLCRLSAEQDNSVGQWCLAHAYYDGEGVAQDYGRAFQLFSAAALIPLFGTKVLLITLVVTLPLVIAVAIRAETRDNTPPLDDGH